MKSMTKNLSARLSAHAVCPDLYRGKVGNDKDEASHLFSHLDWPAAIADIATAVRYLHSVGCSSVGVVGFICV